MTRELKIHRWPDFDGQFDCNGLALICLCQNTGRDKAATRNVLASLLLRLGLAASELAETPQGPIHPDVKISLSYARGMALIALSLEKNPGVDIVCDETPTEAATLQSLYFPAAFCKQSFAAGWAALEACCKAHKLPLTEITPQRENVYAACELIACEQIAGYRIALAIV